MVSIMSDTRTSKTPWHLWVVGAIAVLFNAVGVFDYVMSKTQGATYMASAGMTPEQIAIYQNLPTWMTAVWAIGVFSAFLASVLLLLKNKVSAAVFALSLTAFWVNLAYLYLVADAGEILGQGTMISSAVISVMLILFALYSRTMGKRGVLR